ncbi:HalOD1 output domain-containing protein [Halovivax gelatinilyticus]|uniref:HalOD1 output domain-containing protein n=1 Tax=Halovivax gelatinilyticus TaxID=2961597 RepID=UPI0020CA9226|nr:HalOD1 output domain-containing protein [Halovivax gelatinilyticus]
MDSPHSSRFFDSSDSSPSYRVVTGVAEREGVEPESLEPPLYAVIDPEALDSVIEGAGSDDVTLSFSYAGYAVSVDGDGSVTIDR